MARHNRYDHCRARYCLPVERGLIAPNQMVAIKLTKAVQLRPNEVLVQARVQHRSIVQVFDVFRCVIASSVFFHIHGEPRCVLRHAPFQRVHPQHKLGETCAGTLTSMAMITSLACSSCQTQRRSVLKCLQHLLLALAPHCGLRYESKWR